MSGSTTNLNLVTWDASDQFDYAQLKSNWITIDNQFSPVGVFTTPIRFVELVSALPSAASRPQGSLVYTQNATTGFAANQILRSTGSSWANVGPLEIQNSLPTSSNNQGRAILLSAAAGGFNQWDLVINTDGANAWQAVGRVAVSATVAGLTNNFAGKLGVLSSADSGFSAWTLLVYNGTSWQSTETRGVQTATSLPSSPYTGQVFGLTAQVQPFVANDIVTWDGSKWRRLTPPPLVTQAQFTAMTSVVDSTEVYLQVDAANNTNWHMRYNSSVATYPWEFIGGNPQKFYQTGSDTVTNTYGQLGTVQLTLARSGVYWLQFGCTFRSPSVSGDYIIALGGGPFTANDSSGWGASASTGADPISVHGQTDSSTISAGSTITLNVRCNGGNVPTSPYLAYIRAYPIKINQS